MNKKAASCQNTAEVRTKVKYKLGIPRIDKSLGGIPGGTNLLIKTESFAGKDRLVEETVSEGFESGEGTVYVTTEDPEERVLEEYPEDESFGVVDCVTEGQETEGSDGTGSGSVKYAGSPSDMTSIGVKVSDFLSDYRDESEIEQNRVLLDSVSTLLMYSNLETVFRFLHVFTGRIRSIDGVGVFVLDAGMHDEKVYTTLRQLFDGVVEVEDYEDGVTRVRVVGLTDEPTEWVSLE